MVLPGIIPRARNLFASGFGYLAFLMANIYNIVRLLPAGHPYLNPQNIGRFGIRHVIAEAANNLVLSRKNIDQFIIFFALLAGVIILILQVLLLIYGYIVQPALAGGGFTSMFTTQAPVRDIAFILLDKVFGIPGMFRSCVDVGAVCKVGPNEVAEPGNLPHAFHLALHNLFQFYSMGLLIIAVLIFLYFVVVVVAETATTGTPFGQRFQNVWVPIRLVVALGLLLPIAHGLNSGQYIALYAAKFGSSFATNGWLRFNNTLAGNNPTGEIESMLAFPHVPDITPTVQFMGLVHGCTFAYWHMDTSVNKSFSLGPSLSYIISPYSGTGSGQIKAYLVKNAFDWNNDNRDFMELQAGTDYTEALDFYDNADIVIRFGIRHHDDDRFEKFKGNVEPTCGEIKVHIADVSNNGNFGGGAAVQRFYFDLIKTLWFDHTDPETLKLIELSQRFMAQALTEIETWGEPTQCHIGCDNTDLNDQNPACTGGDDPPCKSQTPPLKAKTNLLVPIQIEADVDIFFAWEEFASNPDNFAMPQEIRERGWGGAGIWYNRINAVNGVWMSAVYNVPGAVSYPIIMETVRTERMSHDSDPGGINQFSTHLSGEDPIKPDDLNFGTAEAGTIGKGLSDYFVWWNADGANTLHQDKIVTGSVFQDVMNLIFGTHGIMAMRGENAHIHPLAQLAAVGKGLVDSSVRNIALSTFTGAMGGPAALFDRFFGQAAQQISSFLLSTAFIGLTAGVVLFYVLPFLPFVYFFFAVGSWIKTIFEAMVGVPLWALAHLRLDGEGLPGDSASNGYFLIFEIFIRPILTVFGLLASVIIFTAQVRVLNFVWDLVVDNLTGFSGQQDTLIFAFYEINIHRDIIDQFFFTVLYTIIVYMLATASFKLIDTIPDTILRWMGAGVSSFSDINDDPTQGLTRYAAIGGITFGQKAVGSVQQLATGIGNLAGEEAGKLGGILGTLNRSGQIGR